MTPCDPKEYQHLLYDKKKFKGLVKDFDYIGRRYHLYILKDRSPEEQFYLHGYYHVALLDTGELVCVNNGHVSHPRFEENALYIGDGVIHHDEYW